MKNKNRKGVTLLELIIAMAILSVASMPILHMIGTSVRSNADAHRATAASIMATQQMEELIGRPWHGNLADPDNPVSDALRRGAFINVNSDGFTGWNFPRPSADVTGNIPFAVRARILQYQNAAGVWLPDLTPTQLALPTHHVPHTDIPDDIVLLRVAVTVSQGRTSITHTNILNVIPGGIAEAP